MLKEYSRNISKRRVEYEDLPALMYLQYKVFGLGERFSLKHIVVDEAQDFGEFQFSVLKQVLGCESMTVFGDLAQGIYSYRGLGSWEDMNANIFAGEAELVFMQKSYRTTIEIMEEANIVLSKVRQMLNIELATPVVRHGAPVNYIAALSFADTLSRVADRIGALKKEGNRQIAIIAKTEKKCIAAHGYLAQHDIEAGILTSGALTFDGGVSILPAYLSKGLEFEAVILIDVDNQDYPLTELDAKLLYVSMTRAMHSLDIFYVGAVSDLLQKDCIG
jgi:DNA helicase-2/ATP-dependent DNA helicase PcrA